jgi:hypothetical protein
MLTFELPEILWRVKKNYKIDDLDEQFHQKVIDSQEILYFKDINLAEEYTKSYNEGSMEYVEVEKINGESYGYSLPIYLTIEIIDTIDLIPKVVDM